MGSSDPMAVLTAKLTGSTATRPRLRTAYNLWGPSNRCFVDPVFQERVRDGSVPARQQAALRSAIYKEMFEELPENEQREWAEKAEREHREALEKVSGPLKAGPSTAPQDRQRFATLFHCLGVNLTNSDSFFQDNRMPFTVYGAHFGSPCRSHRLEDFPHCWGARTGRWWSFGHVEV